MKIHAPARACGAGEIPRFMMMLSTTLVALFALVLPESSDGEPGAGKRVEVTAPEYAGTEVHHTLYLPEGWEAKSDKKWPVIVEYTGNYYPKSGSTGKVEDAGLGFGISRGKAIWVALPYVAAGGKKNEVTWWGDAKATVEYAKTNVPRICAKFGGDPERVVICGFSRGAIGVNFIGLHDDEIAKLWCGFVTHDHYDGVREWGGTDWGAPLDEYRKKATERLKRLDGRPVLVCQNGHTRDIDAFVKDRVSTDGFTFLDIDARRILGEFPNTTAIHPHTDRWLLKPSPEREKVWVWMASVCGGGSASGAD